MSANLRSRVVPGTRKVLLIDDDRDCLTILALALKGLPGVETVSVGDAEEGLRQIESDSFDIVLTDVQLPGRSGIEFITAARELGFRAPIVVLTSHSSVEAAVAALKHGASDYLNKPVEPERLRALVQTLLLSAPAMARRDGTAGAWHGMIGDSPSMREVFERIRRVARTDATVLIVGESGSGKELVARAIHQESARASGPFVPVHTGAIPRELIASELFGHEKGSFTGAVTAADGKFDAALRGTLFLDEIGSMELAVQIALLRVLETFKFTRVGGRKERDADVRVVAATNRDLLDMVREGTFREDLYYRVNVFTVALPPLRDRVEDIPVIAQHYLSEFARRYGAVARQLSPRAIERLCAHPWPGNVRELRNVMEQTAVFAQNEVVQAEDVQLVSTRVLTAANRFASAAPPAIVPDAAAIATPDTAAHPSAESTTPEPFVPETAAEKPAADRPAETSAETSSGLADKTEPSAPTTTPPALKPPGEPEPATAVATREPTALLPSSANAATATVARRMLGMHAEDYDDDALVLPLAVGTPIDEAEKLLILRTLDVLAGNKQQAARVLGISRRSLYNKLASYGISTAVAADPPESDDTSADEGASQERGSAPPDTDRPSRVSAH